MTKRITLGLLAAASLAATVSAPVLATSEPETDTPIAVDIIEGVDWTLLRQGVEGTLAELPDGLSITLLMEDGEASGNGGCNDYFASYQRDGDQLMFSDIGSTEMYCDVASDQEAAYFANLGEVTTGFSTGGTLVMTGVEGDPILEFEVTETGPIPTDGIEGLTWELDSLVLPAEDTLTLVPEAVMASMTLDNGQVTGTGGCNSFSASYELEGAVLSFSEIVRTRMACPAMVMQFEDGLLSQLESVASWSSDGGSATFYDASGAELARFTPATEG